MIRKGIYLILITLIYFSCSSRKVTTSIVRSDCNNPDVNNENLYFLKEPTKVIETDKIIHFYNEMNLTEEKIVSTGQLNYKLNDELIYFSTNKNCEIRLRRYDGFLVLLKSHHRGEFGPSSIVDFQISEMFIFNIDSNYRVSFSKPIKLMLNKCEYNWRYSDFSIEKFEKLFIKVYAIEEIDFDKETIYFLKPNHQIETHNLIQIEELPVDCGINN